MMNDINLTIRVPAQMRDAFIAACQANDVTASQVLRAAMRSYLERNAQSALPLRQSPVPRGASPGDLPETAGVRSLPPACLKAPGSYSRNRSVSRNESMNDWQSSAPSLCGWF